MEKLLRIGLITVAAITFGCGAPTENRPANSSNAANATNANSANKATAAGPSKEDLTALETKAMNAWKNKDGKFFEGFLTDKFVSITPMGRADKVASVKEIGESKCEVKSTALTDGQVTVVDANTAVFTSKTSSDYTCSGQKGPADTWSATIYVKEGDAWKAAYHSEAMIPDKNAKPENPKAENSKAPAKGAEPAAAKPDELTATLTDLEKKGWEAWKNKDASTFDKTLAKDFLFLSSAGRMDKAATTKLWTEHNCDIKSWSVTAPSAVSLSPTLAILTFKGNAAGKCGDEPLMDLWGTNLLVKDGDSWKSVFYMNTM